MFKCGHSDPQIQKRADSQVASALASVEVAEFQPKQGYTIPTESTDGESKPTAAATDDHEVIKTLADKLKVYCKLSQISIMK